MDSAIAHHIDDELRKIVAKLDTRTDVAICGMAQGVDQMFAEICMEFHMPVHAYVPFTGQEKRWPITAKNAYKSLINRCDEVVVCSDRQSKSAFILRNALMVKAADQAVAVWDGVPYGGTARTVELIQIARLPCVFIKV